MFHQVRASNERFLPTLEFVVDVTTVDEPYEIAKKDVFIVEGFRRRHGGLLPDGPRAGERGLQRLHQSVRSQSQAQALLAACLRSGLDNTSISCYIVTTVNC